jgi:hypothetical protein
MENSKLVVGDTVIRRFKKGSGKIIAIKGNKAQVKMIKNKIWIELWRLTKI